MASNLTPPNKARLPTSSTNSHDFRAHLIYGRSRLKMQRNGAITQSTEQYAPHLEELSIRKPSNPTAQKFGICQWNCGSIAQLRARNRTCAQKHCFLENRCCIESSRMKILENLTTAKTKTQETPDMNENRKSQKKRSNCPV